MQSFDEAYNLEVSRSRQMIASALRMYQPNEMVLATGGGKDSLVLEHLINEGLSIHYLNDQKMSKLILKSFPSTTTYLPTSIGGSEVEGLTIIEAPDMKKALQFYKSLKPNVRAIFMGSRNDDHPAGTSLPLFEPTTSDWPAFMRINPIANWSYHQIWRYIDEHRLKYAKEYEQGYTSLGVGCKPNPSLLREDGTYKHARELIDSSSERSGRV